MEPFGIGSMLRESLGVALRHGAIFLIALLALGAAVLANSVLITRCMMAPACLPTGVFSIVVSNFDLIVWSANRAANWLICGFAILLVLRSGVEANRRNDVALSSRRKGFGRCVLYLMTISMSYLAVDAVDQLLAPIVYLMGWRGAWIAFVSAIVILQIAVWAYVDARFAPYIVSLVCAGRPEGFLESWRQLKGNRSSVFFLFFVLEAFPTFIRFALPEWEHHALDLTRRVADLERMLEMPRNSLVRRLPAMTEFVVYVVISNALCAGAMLVIHEKMRAQSTEGRAAVFD